MIKNLIFDMGKVILDFIWEDFYISQGLTGATFEKVSNATVRNKLWNEFDRNILTYEEIVDRMVKTCPECEKEIRDVLRKENFPKMIRKYPYTDELLDKLKENGYKIYILSNFPEPMYDISSWSVDNTVLPADLQNGGVKVDFMTNNVEHVILPAELDYISKTDGQIISYQHNVVKPEKEIYELLLHKFSLDPNECLFIDDKLENVEGALHAGIDAIQFISLDDALSKMREKGVRI